MRGQGDWRGTRLLGPGQLLSQLRTLVQSASVPTSIIRSSGCAAGWLVAHILVEQFTTSQHPTVNLDSTLAGYQLSNSMMDIIRADVVQNIWSYSLLARNWLAPCSLAHYWPRCHRPMLDCIVCDPPYGVRAGATRIGCKEGVVAAPVSAHDPLTIRSLRTCRVLQVAESLQSSHIPQTVGLSIVDMLERILELAAALLVIGGRSARLHPSS